jgi:hypothetical protein
MSMDQTLNIGKFGDGHYKFSMDTDDGRIICDVSVKRRPGPPDMRSDDEKKSEALGKAKALAQALDKAIIDDGA